MLWFKYIATFPVPLEPSTMLPLNVAVVFLKTAVAVVDAALLVTVPLPLIVG